MQTECQIRCSKLQGKADFNPGSKLQDIEKSQRSGIINSRRSPSQSQKSVHIVGVTSVKVTDSYRKDLRGSKNGGDEKTTSVRDYGKDSPSRVSGGTTVASQNSSRVPIGTVKAAQKTTGSGNPIHRKEAPIEYRRMASPAESGSQDAEWDPNSHDPCPPTCPMSEARKQAIRKAKLRQERLDDYLVNKGFRYFDDICTCSSICLITQLRRDKFVRDMIKSACLFGLGLKLCEELDFWNLFG